MAAAARHLGSSLTVRPGGLVGRGVRGPVRFGARGVAAPPARGLYSLAWTKLLAADAFPEHFLPGLTGTTTTTTTTTADPAPPQQAPFRPDEAATVADIVEGWGPAARATALDARELALNRALSHFVLPAPSATSGLLFGDDVSSARGSSYEAPAAPTTAVGGVVVEEPPADRNGPPTEKLAIKRTFQPSLLRRKRQHGFLARNRSRYGRRIMKRRQKKGRWRICA